VAGKDGPEGAPVIPHDADTIMGHGCFQKYLCKMGRATSARCHHFDSNSDSPGHTLFDCEYWRGHREELSTRFGHCPGPGNPQEILCGPAFESLPVDQAEKASVLREAEETFRHYYRMVEVHLDQQGTGGNTSAICGKEVMDERDAGQLAGPRGQQVYVNDSQAAQVERDPRLTGFKPGREEDAILKTSPMHHCTNTFIRIFCYTLYISCSFLYIHVHLHFCCY